MSMQDWGNCKLCGEYRHLTFEHVPPKSSFNNTRVHVVKGNDALQSMTDGRAPWDLSGIHYRNQQKGKGGYYLCEDCNNKTGSWYANEYVRFIQSIWNKICSEDLSQTNVIEFNFDGFYPLKLFKEMMVMFCDINYFDDSNLRNYLLSQASVSFDDSKYKVFLYLVSKDSLEKNNGVQVICNIEKGTIIQVSEIISYPIGMSLYIDKPEDYHPVGCDFTPCSKVDYWKKGNLQFKLPILESNTLINADYRSKSEILQLIGEKNGK